jgi:hypothetical protein
MKNSISKTMSTMISLILMLAMAISIIAIPNANAQALIMNLPGSEGAPHILLMVDGPEGYDIDMNGGPGPFQNVSLWIKYPGRPDFTFIGTYLTRDQYGGDLDVYDFDFNETGDFECQWRYPPDSPFYPGESNVEIARVVTADTLPKIPSYAYLGVLPNPIGVGQQVLFHVGITRQLSLVGMGWEDLSITIEKPDGTTDTISGITTDSTGGTGRQYVPNMAGNYTVQGHFPQQATRVGNTSPGVLTGQYMNASDSEVLTLVVLEEPIEFYPSQPLPSEYWTRPIDPQLRDWYMVSGHWLTSSPDNLYAPYNDDAPETAHILWTKPLITGGLVGGDVALESSINFGPVGFETGDAYEGKWTSRFIIAGILIYTHSTNVDPLIYTAVNLRTGEELWTKTFLDNRSISMCQTFYWQTYNYMGTYSYIWVTRGSTWYAFDPFDATHRITMTNVPSGDTVVGERGEIYRISVSTSQQRMTVWNMSALISMTGSFRDTNHNSYDAGGSNPTRSSQRRAWAMNITIPEGLPGSDQRIWLNDRVVGASLNDQAVRLWGFSLEPGREGTLLFNNTYDAPAYWEEGGLTVSGFGGGWVAWSQEDRVAVMWIKETREHYGFSLETGKYLWGPTKPQYYLDSVEDSVSQVRHIAYGNFYSASVGGICYAYNATTGELQWIYEATDPYHDYLMANTWWLKPMFITDGKIYLSHTEHSANQPMPRGAPFICLNATTGEEIWRINGAFRTTRWGGRAIIGDSVIATMDTYDQRLYAIGKGPSDIIVTAGPKSSVHGSGVVVEGMVTDVSPGTNDIKLTTRFPNGVPAVSDEDMSDWMLHVYKQFERPADVVGVEVVVSVLDPNDNYYEVARTNGDANGYFGCTFTPEVPGFYKIVASFEGSNAYYGSFAETYVNVEEAPLPPIPAEALVLPPTESYITAATVAIIIAIAIVGLLLFRKR